MTYHTITRRKIMRFVLIFMISFLLLLFSISCGQHLFGTRWAANAAGENIDHYRLFVWTGNDTTEFPYTPGQIDNSNYLFLKDVPQVLNPAPGDTVFSDFYAEENGQRLLIAVSAVNDSGTISFLSISKSYKTIDGRLPTQPGGLAGDGGLPAITQNPE